MPAKRLAAIDVGTNTALLLVADISADAGLQVLEEREEITGLGRGVDATKTLSPERIDRLCETLKGYVALARSRQVSDIVGCATSAVRDASNRHLLLEAVKRETGLSLEVISGELEAELNFLAAHHAFGRDTPGALAALDIGGGSTEWVYGEAGVLRHKASLDIGSVRLTERFAPGGVISPGAHERARAYVRSALAALPPLPPRTRCIGVAATVTNVAALLLGKASDSVHGATLERDALTKGVVKLMALSLEERRALPHLDPRRAEVLPMGALILDEALQRFELQSCTVSDRGLRYGLLLRKGREREST